MKRENVFSSVVHAVTRGSSHTKISALVMGYGQFRRKQFVKGALYLLAQITFVAFIALFGWRYLVHLFSGNLGSKVSGEIWNEQTQVFDKVTGDNSFLILLYSVVTVAVTVIFIAVWSSCVKGSYENDLRLAKGVRLSTFSEDISELINKKFYRILLLAPLIGLLVFTLLPLVFMVLIAFTSYDYNHKPITVPPGMVSKIFGSVTNIRPGP